MWLQLDCEAGSKPSRATFPCAWPTTQLAAPLSMPNRHSGGTFADGRAQHFYPSPPRLLDRVAKGSALDAHGVPRSIALGIWFVGDRSSSAAASKRQRLALGDAMAVPFDTARRMPRGGAYLASARHHTCACRRLVLRRSCWQHRQQQAFMIVVACLASESLPCACQLLSAPEQLPFWA